MLLSLSKKFLFIHVYKTGGVSVTHALRSHLNPLEVRYQRLGRRLDASGLWRCWKFQAFNLPEHASAECARKVVGPEIFNRCFKFAFVRNPWSLQLSMYRYVMSTPDHRHHAAFKALPDFTAYIEWLGTRPNGSHRIQRDFLTDAHGNRLVDFIGRFENLHSDYAGIAKRYGWDARLPHYNKSEGDSDFRNFYTPRTRDIVGDLHRADVEAFNYDF